MEDGQEGGEGVKGEEMKKPFHKLTTWILRNNLGQVLCVGGQGKMSRFHLVFPSETFGLAQNPRYIHPAVRWLARKCAKVANEEIRKVYKGNKGLKDLLVRPVRVEISWKEI